jgi:hypothetical protein
MNIYHSILPPQYNEKKIHPETLNNINKWISLNNDITLIQKVFDVHDCINFLNVFSKNFGLDILSCFNNQPDGRYKSDIWRMCILYEEGGLYSDIDQEPIAPINNYLDLDKIDFCCSSNMGLHNISNGFIYAKKQSEFLKKSIIEVFNRYQNGGHIGGPFVMGKVFTDITGISEMPIGELTVGNENCLFLHEIGDYSLEKGNQIIFFESFGIYSDNDTKRVMNCRYKNYFFHKHDYNRFISF